jgi:hypothetical protein
MKIKQRHSFRTDCVVIDSPLFYLATEEGKFINQCMCERETYRILFQKLEL